MGAGRSGVILGALLLVFFTVLGRLGFIAIEGWSARDALYMTIITISTVGFGGVHPWRGKGTGETGRRVLAMSISDY